MGGCGWVGEGGVGVGGGLRGGSTGVRGRVPRRGRGGAGRGMGGGVVGRALSASISRPESVSSSTASAASSSAVCRISFRFFSPPEKPVFTSRDRKSGDMPTALIFSATTPKN